MFDDKRILDEFPDFAVDRERNVWSRRSGEWRRLRLSRRSDRGSSQATVIVYKTSDFRPYARTVESLYRAAFDRPAPGPCGPRGSDECEEEDDIEDEGPGDGGDPPLSPPGLESPSVEYRAVPGWDGYAMGTDGSLWSRRRSPPSASPPVWMRLSSKDGGFILCRASDKGPSKSYLSIKRLRRLAFGESTPDHPAGPLGLSPAARGSGHGRAKLDEDQVLEMKRLHRDEGWPRSRIAALFGVSPRTVEYAIAGKTWRHVLEPPPPGGSAPDVPTFGGGPPS
jgi:hypothetical protein